jgi:hypothetical protein
MTLLINKPLIAAVALLFVTGAPAEAAKARKHHKPGAATANAATSKNCRGANLYPCGPVVWYQHYFGDDPDPNIRFQLWRDFNSVFGGGEN